MVIPALAVMIGLAAAAAPAGAGAAVAAVGATDDAAEATEDAARAADAPTHLRLPREVKRGDQVCLQRLDPNQGLVERCPDGTRYVVLPHRLARRLRPPPPPPRPIRSDAGLPYGRAGHWEVDLAADAYRYTDPSVEETFLVVAGTLRLGGFPLAGWRGAATLRVDYLSGEWYRKPRVEFSLGAELLRFVGGPARVGQLTPFLGLAAGVANARGPLAPIGSLLGGVRVPLSPSWGIDARLQAGRRFSTTGAWDLGASASLFFVLPTAGGGA